MYIQSFKSVCWLENFKQSFEVSVLVFLQNHGEFTELFCCRTSTNDAERPGSPREVTSQEMIDKTYDIVLEDRRLKKREINDIMKILTERVFHILHSCLFMRKLSGRWVVLRFLTIDQK